MFFPVFLGPCFREFQGTHCFFFLFAFFSFFFFLLFLELDSLFGGKGINLKSEIDFCVKMQPFHERVSKVSSLNFCPNSDYTTPDARVPVSQYRIPSKYFSSFPNSHMIIFFLFILCSWILPRKTFRSYSVPVCESPLIFIASIFFRGEKKKKKERKKKTFFWILSSCAFSCFWSLWSRTRGFCTDRKEVSSFIFL